MKTKVGMIGLGGIGGAHIKALSLIDDVEISALFDVDPQRSRDTARTLGAKVYESSEHLVDSSGIDALFICSPQFARTDADMIAAQKGIHLLIEKPLGLDVQDVIRKERVIRESGVIHSSGYCLRYLDIVQKAKSYLQDKQIDMVLGYRFGGRHSRTWWNRLELSGGQLVDQTTHQVDLIRYLAGEIDEVYAQFERRTSSAEDPGADIYDVGTLGLRLDNGAVGSVANTCNMPHAPRSEVEIFGDGFYVSITDSRLRIVDGMREVMEVSRMNYYQEQDRKFIEAVRAGSQEYVLGNYTEALQTLAVTLAANESARQRKPMKRASGSCLFV